MLTWATIHTGAGVHEIGPSPASTMFDPAVSLEAGHELMEEWNVDVQGRAHGEAYRVESTHTQSRCGPARLQGDALELEHTYVTMRERELIHARVTDAVLERS